jgi:alkylation response protein AidB-like acyl-CoA dehydrogenase
MTATLARSETAGSAEQLVGPVADTIRMTAAEAEAMRRLPDSLMQALKDAGLFSIYTPAQFGGLDLPLLDALRVVEEVARQDGSTAWTVALGLANGVFTAMLPETSAANVLGSGAALIPAAPAFGVRAVRVEGGYRLTGRWAYNSGRWMAVVHFGRSVRRPGPAGPMNADPAMSSGTKTSSTYRSCVPLPRRPVTYRAMSRGYF